MLKSRIVVFISGNGSNLQAIIDVIQKEQWPIEITTVLSNRVDAYGLIRAQNAGIPTQVLTRRDFANREYYDAALLKITHEWQPDLIVLAGFMHILSPEFISAFPDKIINIHPSLLPKYKGLDTHKRALESGDTEHGCTVHWVNQELDSGVIIGQSACAITANDTVESLTQKVHALEHVLYPQIIYQLCTRS